MARTLHFGTGSVTVKMEDKLGEMVQNTIRRVLPGALEEVERATDELFWSAYEAWPVKTGDSKAGLRQEIVVSQDFKMIRGRVFNDIPYAKYIKPREFYGTKSAFVEYLRKPAKKMADRLLIRLEARVPRDLLHG